MAHTPLVKQLLENRRVVFGFIYALTRDVEAAEEVFQEVSVAVLEEAARQGDVPRFLPWICAVSRNRVSDYYRKRNRQEPGGASLADSLSIVFDQNEETSEEAARRIRGLLECVERLPARQREIVEMHYRDRKSILQIASGVRWKPDAIKVALSKIRKALADCLRGKNLIEGTESL